MGRTSLTKNLSPRHLQLRATLFRRWKTRGLKPGARIESQNEIVKLSDFSLITVMKTLKDLEAEGVIHRQVGKGSYLVTTPWAELYWRIGFFYNRDIVGGGIFDNAFYTRMVVAIEKGVVSDGHEFVLGSFTHETMPINLWDALDAVILTGITDETNTLGLAETTSQVSLIDLFPDALPFHSFRLDFSQMLDHRLKYDVIAEGNPASLEALIKAPGSVAQASRIQHYRNADIRVDGALVELNVTHMDAFESSRYAHDKRLGDSEVLLSEQAARTLGVLPQETLRILGETMTVAGTFSAFGDLKPRLIIGDQSAIAEAMGAELKTASVAFISNTPKALARSLKGSSSTLEIRLQSDIRRIALEVLRCRRG